MTLTGWIVMASGPYDSCAYGPFAEFDTAHDWAAKEWPATSAVEFQIHSIYSPEARKYREPGFTG